MKRSLGLLLLLPMMGFADETEVQALLARIHQHGSIQFNYQETRKLELVSMPWQGQGQMLSSVDGSLVKLQLQPKRVIMVSTPNRMYYWDPEQGQHHSLSVSDAGQAAQPLTLFRSILQGDMRNLQSGYDFATEKQGKHWVLRITPKQGVSNKNAPSIEFSGNEDDNHRQVLIQQADGESTEYSMKKIAEGSEVEKSIHRLLLEAVGD